MDIPQERDRIELLIELISKGYVNQIMLSNDSVWQWLGRSLNLDERLQEVLANWHTAYLFEGILPLLEQRGVTKAQIKTMLVENPRRFF